LTEAETVPESLEPAAEAMPSANASNTGGDGAEENPAASPVRLLFIPCVLVFACVLVWLVVRWPGRDSVSPYDLVRDLGQPGKSHWQQAYTLAELLRGPQHAELKQDSRLAAELAALLDAQLDAGQLDPNRINLRVFLCRALGEFTVSSVQPVLVRASRLERNPAEIAVRRAAVEALATHATAPDPAAPNRDALLETLLATARETGGESATRGQRAELRASAAFALGVLGGEPALSQLQFMLDDSHPNVRYNAATGLARHGHDAAVPVLLEMLDAGNSQAVANEGSVAGRTWKQAVVLSNAIRAAQQWAERNPQADHRPLTAAIETLLQADSVPAGLAPAVQRQARQTLSALGNVPQPHP
jgi:hypothetical protein